MRRVMLQEGKAVFSVMDVSNPVNLPEPDSGNKGSIWFHDFLRIKDRFN
jgi:hypothetical protein